MLLTSFLLVLEPDYQLLSAIGMCICFVVMHREGQCLHVYRIAGCHGDASLPRQLAVGGYYDGASDQLVLACTYLIIVAVVGLFMVSARRTLCSSRVGRGR